MRNHLPVLGLLYCALLALDTAKDNTHAPKMIHKYAWSMSAPVCVSVENCEKACLNVHMRMLEGTPSRLC